ncbi:choice-of-anchor J domain-containing protein [uncultured Chryseobacterium sp.]|uniref:T9SS-dependent choice-of-anchor J family protein n=1 Tax=uncultured Chryseobacterium sp. TaxID=259322 RepID=UPI0026015721|nr:choice-of-anchor J domain-containing protein [uncultured Chryseobacterium sp.]
MLTAAANAQVATINKNFNNFTAGNTTFPQGGWSAVVASPTSTPPPVSPRMIIAADTNDANNKMVQSYAGNNGSTPSYLITPQIAAPSGDKTLIFQAMLVSPSPGPGTIQIGLASSATDMSSFTAVGNPVTLSAVGTVQNISVNIPASALQYIVFRFTPSTSHVAVQIDNVVYNNSSSLAVSQQVKSKQDVRFAVNADNTALEFITKKEPKRIHIYSAGGQQVAAGKVSGRSFDISSLQTGIYYILIETVEGEIVQSKFIKK